MGAYEILVAFGSGMLIGFIAGLIVRGGLPKLTDGDPETRKRFAWFIALLYGASIVADILTDWHTPIYLHLLMGVPVGWVFGVENPIAQILGQRAPASKSSEDPDQ